MPDVDALLRRSNREMLDDGNLLLCTPAGTFAGFSMKGLVPGSERNQVVNQKAPVKRRAREFRRGFGPAGH